MAVGHGGTEGVGMFAGLRGHAEEFQLLGQALSALKVLQGQVDRLAQRWQVGMFELVAMAQAGARQALHQPVQLGDQLAGEAPAVVLHGAQALVDGLGEVGVLGLLEAFGIALQAQAGLGQLGHAGAVPLRARQALPDLQQVAGLVYHPLGEVMLEAVEGWIVELGHRALLYRAVPAACGANMFPP